MKKTLFLLSLASIISLSGAGEVFNENRYTAQGRALERSRKREEAFRHYEAGLKQKLSPAARRLYLNRCAMLCPRNAAPRDYLLRACMVKGGDPTENYRTYQLLGYSFLRESPDKALGYFLNFQDKKKIHPGLVYSGYLSAGSVMERKKQYAKALEFYREALAAGKSVTYKFNFSAAEKAIKRVEKSVNK